MANLLACSRKSTGVIGNCKNNWIPFRCASSRILVFPLDFGNLALCHGVSCNRVIVDEVWFTCAFPYSLKCLLWRKSSIPTPQLGYAPPKNQLNTCFPYHKHVRIVILWSLKPCLWLVKMRQKPQPAMVQWALCFDHIIAHHPQSKRLDLFMAQSGPEPKKKWLVLYINSGFDQDFLLFLFEVHTKRFAWESARMA